MDICMVCLESNDGDILSQLNSESIEWNKYNIKQIIEKHLWWWHSTHESNQWICHECWSSLWSFHTFYLRVERAHNHLFRESISLNKYDSVVSPEATEPLKEDPIPITKRKRGRPRLHTESIEPITIIEDCVAEVKSEIYTLGSEEQQQQTSPNVLDEDDAFDDAVIKEFEDGYISYGSNDTKMSSSDGEKEDTKPVRRKRTTCRSVDKKEKSVIGRSSSVQITKKYDDFIAQNHELFCSLCHVPLSDFQKLIIHFRDEHNTKAFAMCCGKKFYKRAVFVDHLYVHKDPEYFKCEHCGKVLSNRRSLKNHLEWHDETRKPKFNCKECGKDFFRRGGLEKHKLLHVPIDERQHQCDQCDKKFASESLRTQHLKVTHLNKYAKICDICGKTFRERHSFQRHLAEHTGIPTPNIECDICGMNLTSVYGLNRHKRLRHTEENMQEQICPYCSKVSPNIAAHRSHIQYSHTMKRKHACHLCEKAFRRPKELKEHLSTHTGEALYTCPHCPRTFISNANMHKHRKNEHPKEWEEARMKRLNYSKMSASGTCSAAPDTINKL